MRKIAFFINDLRSGGAEKNVAFLANHLVEFYDVFVVCYNHMGEGAFFELDQRIKKITLQMHFEAVRKLKGEEKEKYIRSQLLEIENILLQERPDVSIAFLPNMCMLVADACSNLDMKCIACSRNDPTKELNSQKGIDKRNEAFEKSSGCVFQTEEIQEYFRNYTKNTSAVIPNPVMIDNSIDYATVRKRNSIICVAKYSKQKNLSMLIEAFTILSKKHPEYILEIYGKDYGEKEGLIRYAELLNIRSKIIFEGENKSIQKVVAGAKIFVLSSNYEGMPNALAEAVALGVPSISTDCEFGGPRSILANGKRGILIPVCDVEALYNSMDNLLTNEDLYKTYSKNGKSIIKERNAEAIVGKWYNYIEGVINDDISGAFYKKDN